MFAPPLTESLESMDIDKLPLGVAIAIDKIRDLEGEPTQRIQVTVTGGHVDLNAAIDLLPSEPTNVTDSATGWVAAESEQTREAPAALPAPAPAAPETTLPPDNQSGSHDA